MLRELRKPVATIAAGIISFNLGNFDISYSKGNDYSAINYVDSAKTQDSYSIQQVILNNLNKLTQFAKYEKNWNGYDADPFSPDLISIMMDLILRLRIQPQIFPVADNSIQIEYDGENGRYLEFQIYENGKVHCYREDGKGNDEEKTLDLNATEINKIVEEFYEQSF